MRATVVCLELGVIASHISKTVYGPITDWGAALRSFRLNDEERSKLCNGAGKAYEAR
jgi:hypothetical protein